MRKILQQLAEGLQLLLSGRRVFFIYTHDVGKKRFRFGLKANTEISYWSIRALEKEFPVFFLNIQGEKEHRIRFIREQDVVIGHIGETFLRASNRTRRLIAFYPWAGHEDRSQNTLFNCLPLDQEKRYWQIASSLILLTSEYNQREYLNQSRNFWFELAENFRKNKRLRVIHQPLDLNAFSRMKHDYRTSNFVYVGNNGHMKCVGDSEAIVRSVGRKLFLYGTGSQKLNNLDSKQIKKMVEEADFFIQPGMWEGQCVSILEAASRGFIPVVSPETGYPYNHPFLLRYGDRDYNIRQVKSLLHIQPEERKCLADDLYQRLVNDIHHNSWEMLTSALVEEVKYLYN